MTTIVIDLAHRKFNNVRSNLSTKEEKFESLRCTFCRVCGVWPGVYLGVGVGNGGHLRDDDISLVVKIWENWGGDINFARLGPDGHAYSGFTLVNKFLGQKLLKLNSFISQEISRFLFLDYSATLKLGSWWT